MRSRQIPSPNRFVVKAAPEAFSGARRHLTGLGRLEGIEGAADLWFFWAEREGGDPRDVWQAILDGLPSARWAAPLVVDESGEAHVPTGEVAVRFERPPDEEELRSFAARNGLRVRGRNEFVPEQASFEPGDPRGTYLPDLLAALAVEKGVRGAWASTLSRYHRA